MPEKLEKISGLWKWLVFVVFILIGIGIWTSILDADIQKSAKQMEYSQVQPKTETIILGSEWRKYNLPPNHWFRIDPLDNEIEVKLLDGTIRSQKKGEELSLPNSIPGFRIELKAKPPHTNAKVAISIWPKSKTA